MTVIHQDPVKFGPRFESGYPSLEEDGRTKLPGIPRRHFPEQPTTECLTVKSYHTLKMTAHNPDSFLKIGIYGFFTQTETALRLGENPRIVERAATNAHAGATRLR